MKYSEAEYFHDGEECVWCKEPYECYVNECWEEPGGGKVFQLGTCCETSHEDFVEDFNEVAQLSKGRKGKAARRGFAAWWYEATGEQDCRLVGNGWGDCIVVAPPVEVIRCGPGSDPSDHRALGQREIKDFIRENHRHASSPPAGWRWGYTIWAGQKLIGVAMVGRPAARCIDGSEVIDVSRICIPTEIAEQVRENACSMVYAKAARDGRASGFKKLITYTIEGEAATGCRAAGMQAEAKSKGGKWDRPSRQRKTNGNSTQRKVRWARAC